ncbi:hypothetical protein IQ264_05080 [Phormidium sp. LEGE 05292]|uniref:hypothetical protein n=1 Tax=[Phormidium] sp. LEGE 05292 TaxID=767427 RepID=UPI001881B621|nr:hypothetical protein [Phormidium sp. LEGE 05292]MBE9224841.1 hypothetical protein [Phormidium sp. LEGE 05292]
MNIPAIVDVVIGLIFIYLILSLLASEIQELIATVFQWRAQHLRQSIINLLAGDTITDQNIESAKQLTKDLYNHPLLNDINQEARGLFATMFRKITWFVSWIYQGLTGRDGVFGNKVSAPSYIPGETFATALIERLGIGKLVEPLIEAKFDRFRSSIVENIGTIVDRTEEILKSEELEAALSKSPAKDEYYKLLQVDLYKIYKQFSNSDLTLIKAIDKISLRIEQFIHQLQGEEQKKKLSIWKQVFFGDRNELAIVNGGLQPTIEEVADLINQNSITWQGYKDKINTYYQQRYQDVVDELQNFIVLFDATIRIIINPAQTKFITKENILESPDYTKFWATNSITSEIKLGMPLSSMYEELIKIINKKIKNNPGAKDKLEAFKQGFGEEGRKLLGSKVFQLKGKELFSICLLIGFLIVTWTAVFPLGTLFITPVGGIVFIIILIVIFVLLLLVNKEPKSYDDSNEQGSIVNLVDVFFSPSPNIESNRENLIESFISEFKTLVEEKPENLNWELSRLGQSFRQYYRALIINNADIDLPFIPSSVKQSVTTLVKRAKTKIDRTGNEVNQLAQEIEIWFDRSMDRSSGVYKRNAKGISLLIGFGLAIATNSNSIYIANQLAYDQELRQAIVQGSENFIATENQSASSLDANQLRDTATQRWRDRNQKVSQILNEQLKLPIGWNPRVLGRQLGCEFPKNAQEDDWDKLFDKCIKHSKEDKSLNFDQIYNQVANQVVSGKNKYTGSKIFEEAQKRYENVRAKSNKPSNYFVPTAIFVMITTSGKWLVGILFLLGWIATAIAISMGAPFWFDLLGKVVNVRNTGNKPPSSANQTSVNSEKSS